MRAGGAGARGVAGLVGDFAAGGGVGMDRAEVAAREGLAFGDLVEIREHQGAEAARG